MHARTIARVLRQAKTALPRALVEQHACSDSTLPCAVRAALSLRPVGKTDDE